MSFGEMIKKMRLARKQTLRQFCVEFGHDPSNWSKIERGVNPPPKDEATLIRWASDLGVEGREKIMAYLRGYGQASDYRKGVDLRTLFSVPECDALIHPDHHQPAHQSGFDFSGDLIMQSELGKIAYVEVSGNGNIIY